MEAIGIAGIAQHPQFLVNGLQPVAFDRRHSLGGKPRAERFQFRHRLEHFVQAIDRGPRHDGAAMRPRVDEAASGQLAQGLAHRRARHAEAPCDVGLVERGSRRQRAAHDFIRQLQPQFFRACDLLGVGGRAVDAPDRRRLGGALRSIARKIVKTHVF